MRKALLGSLIGLVLLLPASLAAGQARTDPLVALKLAAVSVMSPLEVARASSRTRSAAQKVREAAKEIKDRELRSAVGSMLDAPAPRLLGATSSYEAFQAAAGGGWAGHHGYPGGLAVHTWLNLRHAWALVDLYRDEYEMWTDRDLVTAAVICHDVLKAWTNQFWPLWSKETGQFHVPPEVAKGGKYAAWGAYGLMGHHNALMASELMYRKAPPRLVFASLSHVDQALDSRDDGPRRTSDETWERTLDDAFTWVEEVDPKAALPYRRLYDAGDHRSMEAGINFLADADWNLTQGRATPWADKAFVRFASRYGLKPASKDWGMARNWAYAHVDPMKVAAVAQHRGIGEAELLIEQAFR
ncbi:MAG: hypothetical protein FJZ00_07705 [Candidatus Sericytochromatia bacterium]|uniref:HD domain-containing protein n=1 Tax=Candidatus Tanganyikabacteria bacterium TaxID=2961651 RepID=A0A937X655_9BACT|nr:hypothetical protein [Candidatus Tanganyikabacteria bacterium]